MNNSVNNHSPYGDNASSPTDAGAVGGGSWFQVLAMAWGQALDKQADTLKNLANKINAGDDKPSNVSMLTAESQRMMFLANSESSSVGSVGQALETMARKQ